jgi:hypothetical protein
MDIEALKIRIVDDAYFIANAENGQDSIGSCNRTTDYRLDYRGVKGYYKKTIILRKSLWLTANDITKKKVLFHELGHCTLNQDHRTVLTGQGLSASIMTSGHLPINRSLQKDFTLNNWTLLLDEMFYYNSK